SPRAGWTAVYSPHPAHGLPDRRGAALFGGLIPAGLFKRVAIAVLPPPAEKKDPATPDAGAPPFPRGLQLGPAGLPPPPPPPPSSTSTRPPGPLRGLGRARAVRR